MVTRLRISPSGAAFFLLDPSDAPPHSVAPAKAGCNPIPKSGAPRSCIRGDEELACPKDFLTPTKAGSPRNPRTCFDAVRQCVLRDAPPVQAWGRLFGRSS